MAISITQISQGTNWVQVRVTGLSSGNPTKSLDYYIDGVRVDSYDTTGGGSTVQFVIENLSAGTSYNLEVRAFYYGTIGGLTDWWADPDSGQNVDNITITTASSSIPYFTVATGTNSIDIWINNLSSYDTIWYDIYDSSTARNPIYTWSGTQLNHTFTGLSSGIYYVGVVYSLNGNNEDIESNNGNFKQIADLSGGGGGQTPYYTYSVTNNSVTITIHNISSGYYYSFWIKDSNDSSTIYDTEDQSSRVTTNPCTIPVTLSPNTTYIIKQVDYSTQSSGSASSLTTIEYNSYGSGVYQTSFTTSGSGPTPISGGYAYIYTGSQWRKAKPYIYTGSQWRPATPYIFDGSRWRKCIAEN